MISRTKKRISVFLCMIMLCSMVPAPASAEQQIVVGDSLMQEDPGFAAEAGEEALKNDVAEEEADEAEDIQQEEDGPAPKSAENTEPDEGSDPSTQAEDEPDSEDAEPTAEIEEQDENECPRLFLPEDSWFDESETEPETLLNAYAEQVLEQAASDSGALQVQGYSIETRGFSAVQSYAYYTLKELVSETAAGNRASTIYTVDFNLLPQEDHVWTAASLGCGEITDSNIAVAYSKVAPSLNTILRALLSACPYELYWFNKTDGIKCLPGDIVVEYTSSAITLKTITYRFVVAEEFTAGEYEVDTQYAQRIQTAIANARTIAGSVGSMSDYEKLRYFKSTICSLTDYNSSAGSSTTMVYGNPWQLIWVFDGDSSTKVVCEGYSKAFQFLCDLCSFSSGAINCYTATGTAGNNRHMWNIVHMDDGKNYLVDVTNCDAGKVGHPELLFLKGWKNGNLRDGYQFRGENSVGAGYFLTYIYDSYTKLTYTDAELTLSDTNYSVHSHTASAPVIENRVEPSYENEGGYEEVVYCSKCGEEISRTFITVDRLELLGTPVLTEIRNGAAAVMIEWQPVTGAKAFHVLRREDSENWSSSVVIGETTETGLADGTAEHGKNYVYTVCCYDTDLGEAASAFDENGLGITRHAMPETLLNALAATCTEDGYSGDYICTECGETVSGHVIEALGHNEEVRNDRPSSYTEEGYSGDVYCTRCGTLLREGTVLPKLEAVVYENRNLTGGNSVKLSAPELNGKTVSWSFTDEESAQYASLSSSGTLKAKVVTERHSVAVLASASDDSVKVLFPVEIVPAVSSILLLNEDGESVTGQTAVFDMNSTENAQLRFWAVVQPESASAAVTWTISDSKGTYASYSEEDSMLTVSGVKATGSVTLTAKAGDGSGKTAKVTLKIVKYPNTVHIEPPGLPYSEGEYLMRGGQSLSLKTNVASEPDLTDRTVSWSLSDDSLPYADISSSGRLTTKTVYEPVSIHVTAGVKSGMEDELCVRLLPSAAAVQIRHDGTLLAKGETIWLPLGESFSLTVSTLPAEAMPGGTWKSSNPRVAAIGEDGRVTGVQAGTATVTYTAADGSGKNTNIKIQVGSWKSLGRITPENSSLKSGKTLTLTALDIDGKAVEAKSLKWESSNPAAVTVSTAGKVTIKTVSSEEIVRIRVYSPYEPEIVKEAELTVSPAKDSLSIWGEGENLTGKTVVVNAAQTAQIELAAKLYRVLPDNTAETALTWTSNNAKIASAEDGSVCFTGSTGTVTVTAKCGKLSAKVSFKVIHAVTGIALSGENGADPILISGKSLRLNAAVSPSDATMKNVTWSSSDPSIAMVSSSGKVTAKTVYTVSSVTVTAAAKDGSGVAGNYNLTVYPAAAAVKIEQIQDGSAARVMNGRTVMAAVGDELQLRAVLCPTEARQEMGVIWSSSNSALARADENGKVTVRAKGSVRITAKANDGSGKSASFTIKIS